MSDVRPRMSFRPMISGMKNWWRNWIATRSTVSRLQCCGDPDVARMADELGMSVAELHQVAAHGPDAADLLVRRMAALDLDRNEVAATVPGTFRDLQRLCTLCQSHRKCAQDLGRNPADSEWEDYCPNVATLKLLDSLPWTARSEW